MKIEPLKNGIVIDHILVGKGEDVYKFLNLDKLDCPVALIRNAFSAKTGKKDIIKIDGQIDLNFEVLGYLTPEANVNTIVDGKIIEKKKIELPETIKNVVKCQNPRCITSIEQELDHVFKLCDKENKIYRCIYCESQAIED